MDIIEDLNYRTLPVLRNLNGFSYYRNQLLTADTGCGKQVLIQRKFDRICNDISVTVPFNPIVTTLRPLSSSAPDDSVLTVSVFSPPESLEPLAPHAVMPKTIASASDIANTFFFIFYFLSFCYPGFYKESPNPDIFIVKHLYLVSNQTVLTKCAILYDFPIVICVFLLFDIILR